MLDEPGADRARLAKPLGMLGSAHAGEGAMIGVWAMDADDAKFIRGVVSRLPIGIHDVSNADIEPQSRLPITCGARPLRIREQRTPRCK